MKEKLYTIEVMDAVKAGNECPCCYLERILEQNAIEFALGASYMEDDIREKTDKQGFCRKHTKMMYDYGNSLGNAWILKTRLAAVRKRLESTDMTTVQEKKSWFGRGKREEGKMTPVSWVREEPEHCYLCKKIDETYERMIDTFVYLLNKDKEFLDILKSGKGFCLPHFADLLERCYDKLDDKKKAEVLPVLKNLMLSNLERVQEDINWFIEKFDYQNQDADWKNSRDAVPRTMQKLTGGYPSDPVFKQRK